MKIKDKQAFIHRLDVAEKCLDKTYASVAKEYKTSQERIRFIFNHFVREMIGLHKRGVLVCPLYFVENYALECGKKSFALHANEWRNVISEARELIFVSD